MANNRIARLPRDALANNRQLQVGDAHQAVDFSRNCLSTAESLEAFSNLTQLTCLDVSNNQMKDLSLQKLAIFLRICSQNVEWLKVLQETSSISTSLVTADRNFLKKTFPNLKVTDVFIEVVGPEPAIMTPKKKDKALVVTPSTLSTSLKRLSSRLAVTRPSISLKKENTLFSEPSLMRSQYRGKAAKKLQDFLKPQIDFDDERRLPKRIKASAKGASFFNPPCRNLKPIAFEGTKDLSSVYSGIVLKPGGKLQAKRDEVRRRKLSCTPAGSSSLII